MTDDQGGFGGYSSGDGDLIEIDLNFESMRRFQGEFSQNLSRDGLFIDTGEPLSPGAVVRFRVILPEAFVFLEGTAVVEWMRAAEAVSDGIPGMALRFVTLSPQNQELVEQLVQDFVDAGGEPFDLDVRPVPADFPTDALEGAPQTAPESIQEGYRLTVRQSGPSLEAEALQALSEAVPEPSDGDVEPTVEDEPEEPREFAILSKTSVALVEEDLEKKDDGASEDSDEEVVDEPPSIDWLVEDSPDEEPEPGPPEELSLDFGETEEEPPEETMSSADLLPVPSDFDDGPEVIDDVSNDDFGGPAFDISLPDAGDEPDSTPVLTDDEDDDFSVGTDEPKEEEAPKRRRLWPLALAAVFVLAVAGGLLWPRFKTWNEGRAVTELRDPAPPAAEVVTEPETNTPVAEAADSSASMHPSAEPAGEGEGPDSPIASKEPPEPQSAPAGPQLSVARGNADAVTAVGFDTDSRGTVISIRANGRLDDGTLSVKPLASPPRILIRLKGILSEYKPYAVEASTAEVAQIRIGHHGEERPPELWVVVDLTGAGITVGGVEIKGETAEVVIAGR